MERKRQRQKLVIFMLMFSIASLSIGFAAFSATLNISSSASVNPNSDNFSVKFSTNRNSLAVGPVVASSVIGGISTTNAIIDNSYNPTLSNLSATFTETGQEATYIVYVRNEGAYTAYLNSINFIGEKVCIAEPGTSDALVQGACNSIDVSVVFEKEEDAIYYTSTTFSNHALEPGEAECVRITLEYVWSGGIADGPFKINFPSLTLTYSTVDNPNIKPDIVRVESGDVNTVGSVVAIGNEKFYVIDQDAGNIKLLSMYNLRVGNSVDEAWNATPLTNEINLQDSDARGYIDGEFPFIGTAAFSDKSAAYSGSIVETYVNNYKAYLTNIGANISSARLITLSELEKLGCDLTALNCSKAPSWVRSTSYWTNYINGANVLVVFGSHDMFYNVPYNVNHSFGVRPVIEIPLSEFE